MSVPGSTAPVVSVTTPANVAVVCCAVLQVAVPTKTRPTKTSIQVLQRIPSPSAHTFAPSDFRNIDMPDWSGPDGISMDGSSQQKLPRFRGHATERGLWPAFSLCVSKLPDHTVVEIPLSV